MLLSAPSVPYSSHHYNHFTNNINIKSPSSYYHRPRRLTYPSFTSLQRTCRSAGKSCDTTSLSSSDNHPLSGNVPRGRNIREPLRFHFRGYTLWLELEQFPLEITITNTTTPGGIEDAKIVSDLDYIINLAAAEKGLQPIPAPHVTLIYGMSQFETEEEVKAVFNGKLRNVLAKMRDEDSISGWPMPLRTIGLLCDIEYEGINGGEMDMAWWEMTLATSPEHEKMVNIVYE